MGVPKFAAWLTRKFPVMPTTDTPKDVSGLYIDLNGLIHPCCHDDSDPGVAERPDEEKMREICLAIENLVMATNPKDLVYIATDGVAPRAKMNQQRARRYMQHSQSAGPLTLDTGRKLVEGIEKEFKKEECQAADSDLRAEFSKLKNENDGLYAASDPFITLDEMGQGLYEEYIGEDDIYPPISQLATCGRRPNRANFDSNCISPGTEFMQKVSKAVRMYVEKCLADKDNEYWGRLTVILSDDQVPGEGEHKLIDFLRVQSSYSGFSDRGSHVIVGLDADLIFLSLSLHIPRMYILRTERDRRRYPRDRKRDNYKEKAIEAAERPLEEVNDELEEQLLPASDDHTAASKTSETKNEEDAQEIIEIPEADANEEAQRPERARKAARTKLEYFDIDALGVALVSEIHELCKLKGFVDLRHTLPEKQPVISSGGYAFDRQTYVEKNPESGLPSHKDPETGSGIAVKIKKEKKNRKNYESHSSSPSSLPPPPPDSPCAAPSNSKIIDDFILLGIFMGNDFIPRLPSGFCGDSCMDNLIEVYIRSVLPYGYLTLGNHEIDLEQLRRFLEAYEKVETMKFRQFLIRKNEMTVLEACEPLRSAVDIPWRSKYYESTGLIGERKGYAPINACAKYIEGIRFVWRYYSSVCLQCSWSWYYPYHYAPLTADLVMYLSSFGDNLNQKIPPPVLEMSPPSTILQLLCVLPPTSKSLLPSCYHDSMVNPPSELKDTFPREWTVDFSGSYSKDYLSTVRVPFADAEAINQLITKFDDNLSNAEKGRLSQKNFHIVLSSAWMDERMLFPIHGSIVPLEQDLVSWPCSKEVMYRRLEDTLPRLHRPRTYSYNSPPEVFSGANDTTSRHGNSRRRMPFRRHRRNDRKWNAEKESNSGNNAYAGRQGNKNESVLRELSFAEFVLSFFLTCLVLFPFLWLVSIPINGFNLLNAISLELQLASIASCVIFLVYFTGIAVRFPAKGSGIVRNTIDLAYSDWQCDNCLFLNFSRNVRCYACKAPFDPKRSNAVFGSKEAADPPLMDPEHSQYIEKIILPLEEEEEQEI